MTDRSGSTSESTHVSPITPEERPGLVLPAWVLSHPLCICGGDHPPSPDGSCPVIEEMEEQRQRPDEGRTWCLNCGGDLMTPCLELPITSRDRVGYYCRCPVYSGSWRNPGALACAEVGKLFQVMAELTGDHSRTSHTIDSSSRAIVSQVRS